MKYRAYMQKALGSYFPILEKFVMTKQFNQKMVMLQKEPELCPDFEHIFRAFRITPYDELRVVWTGQDPYHNGNATGLSFSIPKGATVNPSLQKIKKELENFKGGPIENFDYSLLTWAKQGCLLHNAFLTTLRKRPLAHSAIWEDFTMYLYMQLNNHPNHLVFVHLGRPIQRFNDFVHKHTIINVAHPAARPPHDKFLNSKLFEKINASIKGEFKWF